jgi:hypothetical protein
MYSVAYSECHNAEYCYAVVVALENMATKALITMWKEWLMSRRLSGIMSASGELRVL